MFITKKNNKKKKGKGEKMEENFNNLENNDNKFQLVSNRIAFFYKEVFNIEIINLFYKRNLEKMNNKNVSSSNYLEAFPINVFDFYILVKDYNKKLFKYKLIKARFDGSKYRDNNNQYAGFLEHLYWFVDEALCQYCQKHYMGKHNTKQIDMILEKNEKINNDYSEWIEEKYQNNQEK